ncbi:MAG: intradiol ring-cleavage dioxygenase [Desulfuromonadaceae bacterium GWB2_53_15]|nr:MAG: intradiol ring-cleavage dioxygenase [Desulfuromonadaceae bacterium GWB2_53_15]
MILFARCAMFSAIAISFLIAAPVSAAQKCRPTPWDQIGPFYRPGAPLRTKIGSGYILSGTVRSATDCRPIPGARIEFWQVGTDGTYDDAHRATIIADNKGRYRLETDFPAPYGQRPPHIHILVDMRGFAGLISQHYPQRNKKRATFDLVLAPE